MLNLSTFKVSGGLTLQTLTTTDNLLKISNTSGDVSSISPADLFASLGGVSGTGAANRVALWNGAGSLTSDAGLTWTTGGTLKVTNTLQIASPIGTGGLHFYNNSNNELRWAWYQDIGESTGNNGSNLFLAAYANGGGYIGTYLSINRATGNVGIGTASPTKKLSIQGNGIELSADGTFSEALLLTNNGTSYEGWVGGHSALKFFTDHGNIGVTAGLAMTIDQNQNVIVGTGSAIGKFTVQTSVPYVAAFKSNSTFAYSDLLSISGKGLRSGVYDITYPSGTVFGIGAGGAFLLNIENAPLVLGNYDYAQPTYIGSSGNVHLTVAPNGNVGIGTVNPLANVNIEGSSETTLLISSSDNSQFRGIVYGVNAYSTKYGSQLFAASTGELRTSAGYAGWGGVQTFYTDGVERMRINPTGYVGIGITAPLSQLSNTSDMGGISGANPTGIAWKTTANDWGLVFRSEPASGNGYGARFHTTGATADDYILALSSGASAGTIRVAVKGNGNVGIGTTSPTEKLTVAGRIMSTTSGYTVGATGAIFGYYDASGTPTSYIQAPASGRVDIWNSSTGAIATFLNNGNVGIGTTAPAKNLEIQTPNGPSVIRLSTANAAAYYTDIISNYDSNNAFEIQQNGFSILKASGDAYVAITIGNSAATLVVSPMNGSSSFTGNVGIGTTSPATQFVVSNAGATGYEFDPANEFITAYNRSTSTFKRFFFRGNGTFDFSNAGSYSVMQATPTSFNLYSLAGTGNRVLQTDPSGNVTATILTDFLLPSGTNGQTIRNDGAGWVASSTLFNAGTRVGINTTTPQTDFVISNAGNNGYEFDAINKYITAYDRIANTFQRFFYRGSDYTFNLNNTTDALLIKSTGVVQIPNLSAAGYVTNDASGNIGTSTAAATSAALNYWTLSGGNVSRSSGDVIISTGNLSFPSTSIQYIKNNLGENVMGIAPGYSDQQAQFPRGVGIYPAGTSSGAVTINAVSGYVTSTNILTIVSSTGTNWLSYSLDKGFNTGSLTPIRFSPQGYETMTITANVSGSGNVGIGTASPNVNLEVKVNNAVSPENGIWFTNSNFALLSTGSMLRFGFGANTGNTYSQIGAMTTGGTAYGDLVLNKGGGKVGIGDAPSYNFDVIGTGTVTSRIRSTTGTAILNLDGTSGGVINSTGNMYISNYSPTQHIYFIAGGAERLTVLNGGNVGIGTLSPTQKLDVSGIINSSTEFRLDNHSYTRVATNGSDGGFGGGYNFNFNSSVPIHDSNGATAGYGYFSDGSVRFYTNTTQTAGVSAPEKLRIASSGNVAIGTTTADSKFRVLASNGAGLRIDFSGTNSNYYQADEHYINAVTGGIGLLYLGLAGSAFGTNAPTSKLTVNTDALGVTQTNSSGLALTNTTAAAAGAQQISPAIRWSGSGWKTSGTAASQAIDFRAYALPIQGTTIPSGALVFEGNTHTVGYLELMRLTSAGKLGIQVANPIYNLDVLGNVTNTARLGNLLISDNGGVELKSTTGTPITINAPGSGSTIGFSTVSALRFLIDDTGDLNLYASGSVGLKVHATTSLVDITAQGTRPLNLIGGDYSYLSNSGNKGVVSHKGGWLGLYNGLTADPSGGDAPATGSIWYNSTSGKYKVQAAGGIDAIALESRLPQVVHLTSDMTTSSDALADVTGFSAALVDGKTYKIEIYGTYTSSNTLTGIKAYFILTGGSVVSNGNLKIANQIVSPTRHASIYDISTTTGSNGQGDLSTTVQAAGQKFFIKADIIVKCTGAGTLKFQFANSDNTNSVTLLSNSAFIVTLMN